MECEKKPVDQAILDEYDSLQVIVDELRLANYGNEQSCLVCNVAFAKLEQLAAKEAELKRERNGQKSDDETLTNKSNYPQEAFHIEADLSETGDYSNVLVIPCNDAYVIVSGNEHLCTLARTCDAPECWEQREGGLDDDAVEKLGLEMTSYLQSFNG
jgi:uncharacterized membrane protein